jgi:predicted metallopeptidase
MKKKEYGVTFFPDDGSRILVEINPALTLMDQIEIIGHELAHVKVGFANGHCNEWKLAFENIHKKYDEIYERESKEYVN